MTVHDLVLRDLILAKIDHLMHYSRDNFGPKRRWPKDYDFSALDDEALVDEFTEFIRLTFRQR